jgi:hypothetical protein
MSRIVYDSIWVNFGFGFFGVRHKISKFEKERKRILIVFSFPLSSSGWREE